MPEESVLTVGTHHECYPALDPRINQELSTSLQGKNVVVTGAGRGIGRAIALFLTHASAKSLTVVALEQDEIDETIRLCKEINSNLLVLARAFNVTDEKAVQELMQEVENRFGGADVLACNAGRPPQWLRTEECDPVIWWDTVATSLQHSFLFTRFALPGMQKKKSGSIIYTSSSGAHSAYGIGSYTLGKLGQVRLAEIIHNENFKQYNIKCFAYNPGAVRTRFFTDFEDKATGKPLASSTYIEDNLENQDKSAKTAYSALKDVQFDTPELSAGLVTVLAAGKLDFMSGRYLDARIDVDDYVKNEETIRQRDLHRVRLHSRPGVLEPSSKI
ncbi:hypothetical protein G7Y89_g5317 [Cudoniella acicularis]|uniref:NAD(P)-binding protein n=1 Tax=Cudoniella acicularis TaxID=354080 RepID=A0A8H4RMP7_9HELO|nr:hypothetical protein G7Y89_g5317 [Cudoniella acicularis]